MCIRSTPRNHPLQYDRFGQLNEQVQSKLHDIPVRLQGFVVAYSTTNLQKLVSDCSRIYGLMEVVSALLLVGK